VPQAVWDKADASGIYVPMERQNRDKGLRFRVVRTNPQTGEKYYYHTTDRNTILSGEMYEEV
jgi:hypothetical protein